eukprot:s576_g29.t1
MRSCSFAPEYDHWWAEGILLYRAIMGFDEPHCFGFWNFRRTVYEMGGQEIFESTLFRISAEKGFILILVYVDLPVACHDEKEGEEFFRKFLGIQKIKLTGQVPAFKKGALQFMGGTIHRESDVESSLGVLVYQGCCVKAFSRNQEVPAFRSAEAELSSLVNSKEFIAIAMLIQTIMEGIELDPVGTPLNPTRTYASAELHAKFIQFLVKKRRLLIEHVPGLENPSHGLTKCFKTIGMLVHPEREVGLVQGLNTQGWNWIRSLLVSLHSEEGANGVFRVGVANPPNL